MAAPTVGLALIARDEEETLPRLLGSVEGAFDKIAFVDTGSTDRTVEIFEEWARDQDLQHVVEIFEWCDDFAAARNFADSLLDTDWLCWADCDDEVVGAGRLRKIAQESPEEVGGWEALYECSHFEGECVRATSRERLVRRGRGVWAGRLYEAKGIEGQFGVIPPTQVRWVHRQPGAARWERNYRVMRNWLRDEPDNPPALLYLGMETLGRGLYWDAIEAFSRYLKPYVGMPRAPGTMLDTHRLFAHCCLAAAFCQEERPEEAAQVISAAAAEWGIDPTAGRAVSPAVQT